MRGGGPVDRLIRGRHGAIPPLRMALADRQPGISSQIDRSSHVDPSRVCPDRPDRGAAPVSNMRCSGPPPPETPGNLAVADRHPHICQQCPDGDPGNRASPGRA